jgi:DNA-binding beta-propeller fold protein YncE
MSLHKRHVAVAALAVAAIVVTIAFRDEAARAAPAPTDRGKPTGGVIVLDNCDPEYDGKATYEDNLTFLHASGKLRARVSGLNVCEEVGSPNRVAIDVTRKRVWVAETVGHRLLQYDLDGKEQLVIRDVNASALAVDPATGNVWVAAQTNRVRQLDVYDAAGKRLKSHDVSAYDLAYDAKSKAMWAVEKYLRKLSLDGKTLVRKHVADWFAVSVAVNNSTGDVWTVSRRYSDKLGANALLGFDNDGKARVTAKLADDAIPFRVAVNPRDGSVWVVNIRRSLLHYDSKGKRIAEHKLEALTVAAKPGSDNVWIVTQTEILDMDSKGKVVGRTPLRAKTSQAWIAAY